MYAEVSKKTDVKEFTVDKNCCYAMPSNTRSKGSEGRGFFYLDDPLWDGAGCGPENTCCSLNTPPWFHRQLPQPTTDSIEMRLCIDEGSGSEDILIEQIEIYVQ